MCEIMDDKETWTLDEWAAIVATSRAAENYITKLIRDNGWDKGQRRTKSEWQRAADMSGLHPTWRGYRRDNGNGK